MSPLCQGILSQQEKKTYIMVKCGRCEGPRQKPQELGLESQIWAWHPDSNRYLLFCWAWLQQTPLSKRVLASSECQNCREYQSHSIIQCGSSVHFTHHRPSQPQCTSFHFNIKWRAFICLLGGMQHPMAYLCHI